VRQTLPHFLQVLRLVLQLHLVKQLLLLRGQRARVEQPVVQGRRRGKTDGSGGSGGGGSLQLVRRECRPGRLGGEPAGRGRHDQAGRLLALQERRRRLMDDQGGRLLVLTADYGRHVVWLLVRLHLNRRLRLRKLWKKSGCGGLLHSQIRSSRRG
jgi:hypothetical protein